MPKKKGAKQNEVHAQVKTTTMHRCSTQVLIAKAEGSKE